MKIRNEDTSKKCHEFTSYGLDYIIWGTSGRKFCGSRTLKISNGYVCRVSYVTPDVYTLGLLLALGLHEEICGLH